MNTSYREVLVGGIIHREQLTLYAMEFRLAHFLSGLFHSSQPFGHCRKPFFPTSVSGETFCQRDEVEWKERSPGGEGW
jgi:hypothetical protein